MGSARSASLLSAAVVVLLTTATLAEESHDRETPTNPEEADRRCRGRTVTLNFFEAQLQDVIAVISGATGRRFIVSGSLPEARITIISPRPVCPNEAYEAFLSALAAQRLTVVRRGRFHVVMTAERAARGPIPVFVER